MPKPNLTDANIEFEFSQEESLVARTLDSVKIAWLQTKYAQYWKLKNSTPVPEATELDRSYFIKIAEIEGRMNFIQELLDDHKTALRELNEMNKGNMQATSQTDEATAKRADQLVHRIQTS